MCKIAKAFIVLALLAGNAVAQHDAIVRGEIGAQLDAAYKAAEADGFAGAILIARDGAILLQNGYGLANRTTETPWTPATVSTIGSITKPFTAVAILQLASQDKLSVNDPITRHFDDVPADKQHITLHHLLTHSSGLKGAHGGDFDKHATREVVLERAMEQELFWGAEEAGSRYEYSNTGYSLLAMIVEDVAGVPYEQYLRENILEPAGMVDTGYTRDWDATRFAHGYRNGRDTGVVALKHVLPDGPAWTLRGNGGLHSTIVDLYRFHRALDDNTILPAEWKERMLTAHVQTGDDGTSGYGYGMSVATSLRGTPVAGHTGGNGVFSAVLRVDKDTVLIAMSNVAEIMSLLTSDVYDVLFPSDDQQEEESP